MINLRSISHLPRFLPLRAFFSEAPNPKISNKPESSTSSTDERSQFDNFAESFFEILKKSDKKAPFSKLSETNYSYHSRTIYHNKVDPKIFTSNTKYKFVLGTLWVCISYASFIYIHPLITILPLWFASGSFIGFFLGNNYAKKLVHKIIISEDQKNVSIYVAKGKNQEIKAKIEDMDLFDIVELKDRTNNKENEKVEKLSNNFVAVFDLIDIKGNTLNELRLFIEPKNIEIENIDLFKNIMMGNQEAVDKFKFIEENVRQKEEEKEEKDLERKIEEEFERIKQENEEKK